MSNPAECECRAILEEIRKAGRETSPKRREELRTYFDGVRKSWLSPKKAWMNFSLSTRFVPSAPDRSECQNTLRKFGLWVAKCLNTELAPATKSPICFASRRARRNNRGSSQFRPAPEKLAASENSVPCHREPAAGCGKHLHPLALFCLIITTVSMRKAIAGMMLGALFAVVASCQMLGCAPQDATDRDCCPKRATHKVPCLHELLGKAKAGSVLAQGEFAAPVGRVSIHAISESLSAVQAGMRLPSLAGLYLRNRVLLI